MADDKSSGGPESFTEEIVDGSCSGALELSSGLLGGGRSSPPSWFVEWLLRPSPSSSFKWPFSSSLSVSCLRVVCFPLYLGPATGSWSLRSAEGL